jgi:hypothetical protein
MQQDVQNETPEIALPVSVYHLFGGSQGFGSVTLACPQCLISYVFNETEQMDEFNSTMMACRVPYCSYAENKAVWQGRKEE